MGSSVGSSTLSGAGLLRTAMPNRQAASSEGLTTSARQFESILLNQWLQGAESSFGSVPKNDEDGEQETGDDQLRAFGTQCLAKAFSDSGGIGLADMVSKALRKQEGSAAPSTPYSTSQEPNPTGRR